MEQPITNLRIALSDDDMERLRLLQANRKRVFDIAGNYSQADTVRFALKYAVEQLRLQ